MASLTIRKLDDAIRDELRLRAARNGRSVEDEVRGDPARGVAEQPPYVPPAASAGGLPGRARDARGWRAASACHASP